MCEFVFERNIDSAHDKMHVFLAACATDKSLQFGCGSRLLGKNTDKSICSVLVKGQWHDFFFWSTDYSRCIKAQLKQLFCDKHALISELKFILIFLVGKKYNYNLPWYHKEEINLYENN